MSGRVLSKANESKLRAALKSLADVLGQLGDDASDEAKEAWKGVQEAANLGDSLEARLHMQFVAQVDDLFGSGKLTRPERQDMLAALELALQSFAASVRELAPQVYARSPWEDAPAAAAQLGESAVVESDVVPLIERAVRADGTAQVRLIAPGWGSSGYYPAEVLERDGPRVFTQGLKMLWNHPTAYEDAERPEGDLNALAAELVSDARWEPNHPAGAGLYAETKVFSPYQEAANELAPHIGVSIRALGRAAQGEAEGRQGPIIQALTQARSVDFVTIPGANGRIIEMFESAGRTPRTQAGAAQAVQEGSDVAEKEMQEALARAQGEIARMREALILRDATDFVRACLGNVALPDVTKARLVETLSANPPVREGALDREAFGAAVDAAVTAEGAYLAEAAQWGRVVGMGAGQGAPAEDTEQVQAKMADAFARLGLSENGAKAAAAGRKR